jgi:hypothetical protein
MPDFLELREDASMRRVLFIGAALLIAIPFVQTASQLWPLQPGNIKWRFDAANALSSVLLMPFLGLALLQLMARSLGSNGLRLTVGVVSSAFTLGLVASGVVFALDALQLQAIVSSQMATPFRSTAARVVLVTAMFTLAFLLLTLASLKSRRRAVSDGTSRSSRRRSSGASSTEGAEDLGLLVAKRAAKAE